MCVYVCVCLEECVCMFLLRLPVAFPNISIPVDAFDVFEAK